jgi:uncharacterized protein
MTPQKAYKTEPYPVYERMKNKFAIPVIAISIAAAAIFGLQWAREQQQVTNLVIATGGKDGEYYAFAQAFATVVNRHQPKIQVSVLATEGSRQNLNLLDQQQVQLAIVQSDTTIQDSVQVVTSLFPEVFHLIARPNSGIRQIGDLQGKRVALMPKGSGSYNLFWSLSRHYGLKESDFTPVPLPPDDAYKALRQGEVDALFRIIAIGNSHTGELLKTTNASLVPIDQVESLQLSFPFLEATRIPKGTYDGAGPIPSKDLAVVGVRAMMVTHTSVEPEVIEKITQTLFESKNELIQIYPRAASIQLPEASQSLGFPFHSGAQNYYNQEKPSFLVEYADIVGVLTSLIVLVASGLWQLRSWFLERQKDRADKYNLKLLELIAAIQAADDFQHLQTIHKQLFEIFREVVVDLDQDRLSPESFQSFTVPWEMAITTLRHREMILMSSFSNKANTGYASDALSE